MLKKNPNTVIHIVGFTDKGKNDNDARKLGSERLSLIVKYLVAMGIPNSNLKRYPHKTEAFSPGDKEKNLDGNNRIVFHVRD